MTPQRLTLIRFELKRKKLTLQVGGGGEGSFFCVFCLFKQMFLKWQIKTFRQCGLKGNWRWRIGWILLIEIFLFVLDLLEFTITMPDS